jgi:hypothetical protein
MAIPAAAMKPGTAVGMAPPLELEEVADDPADDAADPALDAFDARDETEV